MADAPCAEWNAFSRKRTTRSAARQAREERMARFKRLRLEGESLRGANRPVSVSAPTAPSQELLLPQPEEQLVQTRVDGAFAVKKPMTPDPKPKMAPRVHRPDTTTSSSAVASAKTTPQQPQFVSPPVIQRSARELEVLASLPPSATSTCASAAPTPSSEPAAAAPIGPSRLAPAPGPVVDAAPALAVPVAPATAGISNAPAQAEKPIKFRSGGSSSRRMISFSPDSKPSKPSPPELKALDQFRLERHRKQDPKLLERMERSTAAETAASSNSSSSSSVQSSSSSSSFSPSRSVSPRAGASAVSSVEVEMEVDADVEADVGGAGQTGELTQSSQTMPFSECSNKESADQVDSDESNPLDIPYKPSPASSRVTGIKPSLTARIPPPAVAASSSAARIAPAASSAGVSKQIKSPAAQLKLHRHLADELAPDHLKTRTPSDEISCKTEKENRSDSNSERPAHQTPRKPRTARALPTSLSGTVHRRPTSCSPGTAGVANTKRKAQAHTSSSPFTPSAPVTPTPRKRASDRESSRSNVVEFTSSSVIEDVGLFNCEIDVEYTGGVYGEGTDGKVTAAVIRGQKVALKRAKPHEGFPEEEAKRRSAIELHYLRRVRHQEGFLQCLGVCDGIDHTCIALEVMDCKLSDYLRRKARQAAKTPSKTPSHLTTPGSASRRRRYTLSIEDTRTLLKKICLPLMHLHDSVNVAHGDLACRNILMRLPPRGYEDKWEPVVKLSDFGRIKTPSSEPNMFDDSFSFFKNCDVGAFAREILFRLLVGEIVPSSSIEQRSLHKHLHDSVVLSVSESARAKLGVFYRLFRRCTAWGVRPTFREIYEHLDDLEYFDTSENGLFPIKPLGVPSIPHATQQLGHGNGANGNGSGKDLMSPLMETAKLKAHLPPSSCSKAANRFETPKASFQRHSARNAAERDQAAASNAATATTTATPTVVNPPTPSGLVKCSSATKVTPKQVNWLKARPVGGSLGVAANASMTHHLQARTHHAPPHAQASAPASASASARPGKLSSTPTTRSPLLTKPELMRQTSGHNVHTPATTTASRRSLQILNKLVNQQRRQDSVN